MFHALQPIILASASPRRHELLRTAGLEFSVHPAEGEEIPCLGEAPEDYTLRAARGKALSIYSALGNATKRVAILAADTIVVLNGCILGKPKDNVHALMMLRALAGAWHTVITGCCILIDEQERSFYTKSDVQMWQAPDELLAAYAATDEPLDKAGGYAVQGAAGFLVRSINGSWSNVVGMPMTEVVQRLLELKVVIPNRV